jgi:hypothetical protein
LKSITAAVQRLWGLVAAAVAKVGRALRSSWRRSGPLRRRVGLRVSSALLLLAAFVTVLALGPHEVESVLPFGGGNGAVSWAELRVERPVGIADERPVQNMVGNRAEWVRSTLPHIDFTIRNEGTKRIAPGRVRIELVDSEAISDCELPQGGGGGEIPIARSFLIDLPVLAVGKERVLYRQLHQEVLPEGAARFRVYFRSLADPFSEELFALNVSLAGEEPGQRLEIGRFLLGLPEAIPRGGSYLPENTTGLRAATEAHSLLPSSWCYRRNQAVIQRFLSLPGERSGSMRLPAEASLPPGWGKLADRRSAAEAVTGLLRSNDLLLGPQLALFAARRGGKRALVQETRRRAVIELRSRIKHWLRRSLPEEAVIDARLLRRIHPSAQAQTLLDRAEVALRKRESEAGS